MTGLYHGKLLSIYTSGHIYCITDHYMSSQSVIIVLIIIFSEMLEAVGHEFMAEFFTCCESALAEDGLLVLQVMNSLR